MSYSSAPLLGQVRRGIYDYEVLSSRVTLLGEQPHERIGELMGSADLLLQGSRREGSGFAVVDALACGLPPVVTDIPSFRYLTDNGRIGALFRTGDAEHLAILADGGGSNGPTSRVWKYGLQTRVCNRHGLQVTVAHYPSGASKWNPIEHRMFSFISKNWAAQPLRAADLARGLPGAQRPIKSNQRRRIERSI